MRRPLRLLSVAHSYVVSLNRRLGHEMSQAAAGQWEITLVAPKFFHGGKDLRSVTFQHAAGESFRVEPVNLHWNSSVHFCFYGRRLKKIMAEGWNLVHCWEEPYVMVGGQVIFDTPKNTPVVFWTAQNLNKNYPPPFNFIERYCLRRCSGWMACGQSVVDTLLPRGYGAKPHSIIPLGTDADYFSPNQAAGAATRRELGWTADGPPVVGYMGRFVPEKGLNILMAALAQTHTPWRALFVGTGPMEADINKFSNRFSGRVRICTSVTHDQVPRYLNAMDVLVAPSQTTPHWREQFGRMIVEAFACGIPVIGADSGEIPFVIADAGMIVPEADISAYAAAIGSFLENSRLRLDYAARGRQRMLTHYSWRVVARQYLDFFSQMLDGKSPSL